MEVLLEHSIMPDLRVARVFDACSGIPAEAHPGRASAKLAADPQHASRLLSHNAKVPINRLRLSSLARACAYKPAPLDRNMLGG